MDISDDENVFFEESGDGNTNMDQSNAEKSNCEVKAEHASDDDNNQWEDVENLCILCDKIMDPSKMIIVKERGLQSLIAASLRRKDKKHERLAALQQVTVHKSCQIVYTRECNIKKAEKACKEKIISSRKRSYEGRHFDFATNCFFCGNVIYHSRQVLRRISKQDTIDNIIAQLNVYQKTDTYNNISSRVSQMKNFDNDYYNSHEVYYHANCMKKFYIYRPTNVLGRPIIDEDYNDILSFIINYILDNNDECQFSLKSIIQEYNKLNKTNECPRLDRIENHLKRHFEDEIIIFNIKNDKLICFKNTLGKCVVSEWYNSREKNTFEEKLRIVDLAAHIILQDIRAMKVESSEFYKSPSSFLNNLTKDVPETLQRFLDILIKTHKKTPKSKSWARWDNKIITVAHILISLVRPKSFLSPLLLGLATMIHKKFAAKGLIECLNNIGLCASYSEAQRFEMSIINEPENFELSTDAYLQFVFDNADHNTATIDGTNTFHCMGGIMCTTPASSVTSDNSIMRLKGALSADSSGKFGYTPLTNYHINKPFNLKNIKVEDFEFIHKTNSTVHIKPIEFIWHYGKYAATEKTLGWHGFMIQYYSHETDFNLTKIIPLPFVNAPPNKYMTILRVLIEARHKATLNKQQHCFVTFDQPLYMKANEIIASVDENNDPHNLKSVIVRLGGFHLLMSYLGSIGNIMQGSGLKEAFSEIFAELSAEKAVSGHAFSRSVRGHLLVQSSLSNIIFQSIELNDEAKSFLDNCLTKIEEDDMEIVLANPIIQDIKTQFLARFENLKNNGPTSQLWLQYFQLICIMQRFIDAERSGNFEEHIEAVKLMLPIFYASGHHLYAKSTHLYLQTMLNLKNIMDIAEYDKFCNQGFFTIRRSNRYWSGVWSDMIIEQVLMRSMKCSGGLTHGRGLTESVVSKWVLSTLAVMEVCNAVEIFTQNTFSTSEQHVDCRNSRITRDAADLFKLNQFFNCHDPFLVSDKIIGIVSRVVGDDHINCYRAFDIGKKLMKEAVGCDFSNLKIKRKDAVVNLNYMNSKIKNIDNKEIIISPLLIFQRISLSIGDQIDMKEYMRYELAPQPLSLFDEYGMRKTAKSKFYNNFIRTPSLPSDSIVHVIDGGYFIHKVVWNINDTIDNILNIYINYAIKHYKEKSLFIFDGYLDDETSTKSFERCRRNRGSIGREINFVRNTKIPLNATQFFSNEKNKIRFIEMLCEALNTLGFRTKTAKEDADLLIINSALELARYEADKNIIIIGQDIDLLVILNQLGNNYTNIYFVKEGKGSLPDEYFNSNSFKHKDLQDIIAFLHIFSGCDTTSCFYKQGKHKLIDNFKNTEIKQLAKVFYEENASPDKLCENACMLIIGLYSNKAEKVLIHKSSSFTLNDLRYLHFSKAKIKTNFAFQSLPPTEGAARQHAYRTYYQLQLWLGNTSLKPTDWGWTMTNDVLVPIGTNDPLMPIQLLKQIACSCKRGCKTTSCGCKKHGIKCSNLCANCDEETCSNIEIIITEVACEDDADEDVNNYCSVNIDVNYDESSTSEIEDWEIPNKIIKLM